MFGQIVELEPYNPEQLLRRYRAPRSWVWRYYINRLHRGLPIMAFLVVGGAHAVLGAIARVQASKVE